MLCWSVCWVLMLAIVAGRIKQTHTHTHIRCASVQCDVSDGTTIRFDRSDGSGGGDNGWLAGVGVYIFGSRTLGVTDEYTAITIKGWCIRCALRMGAHLFCRHAAQCRSYSCRGYSAHCKVYTPVPGVCPFHHSWQVGTTKVH